MRKKGGKGKGKAVGVCLWVVLGREGGREGIVISLHTESMSIGLAEERDWVRLGGGLVCGCGMRDEGVRLGQGGWVWGGWL